MAPLGSQATSLSLLVPFLPLSWSLFACLPLSLPSLFVSFLLFCLPLLSSLTRTACCVCMCMCVSVCVCVCVCVFLSAHLSSAHFPFESLVFSLSFCLTTFPWGIGHRWCDAKGPSGSRDAPSRVSPGVWTGAA